MGLELYSKIEAYLDFEDEVYSLHKEFMTFVMVNELDNIIDIGCGQGYFLENLKINGKKAFGIDLSSEQVKVCLQRGVDAQCMPLNEVKEKYDCATAIFDVINYIPKKPLKEFFKDTYNVLNEGGYFMFDVNSLFGFSEVADGSLTINKEDIFIAIDAVYDNEELNTNITLFEKQESGLYERQEDCITQYYHDKNSLKKLLKDAGFHVEKIKEFNLHGYDQADKYIFICKK
ncbi:class I SAM-dependent DNA methyltransferase [Malaciobacter mytili]|uniref:Methyltransferase n=1 Tax=Malaciobacter mytili LMG 24559 TaxID=1032238 RepID=A0AAX2AEE6_9BACT|nr:class I SAM-dependent methyltransferase [Malaciobacter mytili]AXH14007.1 methyltransferase [Malaciobacter mytili LMG 24559]RXI37872.1 methyltransferase [Malaciobacter mytili]RXK15293.1 methyltransferase [Malaciobacter mytili LMG 24559]